MAQIGAREGKERQPRVFEVPLPLLLPEEIVLLPLLVRIGVERVRRPFLVEVRPPDAFRVVEASLGVEAVLVGILPIVPVVAILIQVRDYFGNVRAM